MSTLGWTSLFGAVAKVVSQFALTEREAAHKIRKAASEGVLYTSGHLHRANGFSFAINPSAWLGMDPCSAISALCSPNPGLEIQEQFVGMPDVHDVMIHGGSLDAWMAGGPKPSAPSLPALPIRLRDHILVWAELHADRTAEQAGTSIGEGPSSNTVEGTPREVERQSTRGRRRGRPIEKGEEILSKMRAMPRAELQNMKEEEMAAVFEAARSTCRTYRNQVLAENGDN